VISPSLSCRPGTHQGYRRHALLVKYAPPAVADAFCASRLDRDWAPTLGTLPAGADVAAIIEFARLSGSA